MAIFETVYLSILAVGAITSALLAAHTLNYWGQAGVKWFTGMLASCALWAGAQFFQMTLTDPEISLFWARVVYIGVVGVVAFFLLFVLEYLGYEDKVNRSTIALVAVEPVLATVTIWTNPIHHLFWAEVVPDATSFSGLAFTKGPLVWVHTTYSYLLLATCMVLLARNYIKSKSSLYRWQIVGLLVALFVPWGANILLFAGLLPFDLTSAGFVVACVTYWTTMYYFELIDLSPVARERVVEDMNEGMFVLDDDERFVDINPTGRAILGLGDQPVIGRPAEDVLSHVPKLYERHKDMDAGSEHVSVEGDDGVRHYQLAVSPISNKRSETIGRLFMVRDITERQRRKRELERQNEQLDQFASLVSHDLRNPLNVADGYVELIEDEADPPIDDYAEEVDVSLERMRRIIDDVLTMAREGQTIEETKPIALHDVAEEAWRNVDTRDATLENTLNVTVQGDRSRVLQVFENLFRNAIDHGRDDVTIRVGSLGDKNSSSVFDPDEKGFYIGDDGPGIPEDKRDEVFDAGHTTHEEGTGLGLSIVSQFVEAHGWEIRVTESESGGARFEITGVTSRWNNQETPRETVSE